MVWNSNPETPLFCSRRSNGFSEVRVRLEGGYSLDQSTSTLSSFGLASKYLLVTYFASCCFFSRMNRSSNEACLFVLLVVGLLQIASLGCSEVLRGCLILKTSVHTLQREFVLSLFDTVIIVFNSENTLASPVTPLTDARSWLSKKKLRLFYLPSSPLVIRSARSMLKTNITTHTPFAGKVVVAELCDDERYLKVTTSTSRHSPRVVIPTTNGQPCRTFSFLFQAFSGLVHVKKTTRLY